VLGVEALQRRTWSPGVTGQPPAMGMERDRSRIKLHSFTPLFGGQMGGPRPDPPYQ